MGNNRLFITIGIIILVIILGGVVFFIFWQKDEPIVYFSQKNDGATTLSWENLPEDTTSINILKLSDNNSWEVWQKITINGNFNYDSLDVSIGGKRFSGTDSYYIQLVSGNNEILWSGPAGNSSSNYSFSNDNLSPSNNPPIGGGPPSGGGSGNGGGGGNGNGQSSGGGGGSGNSGGGGGQGSGGGGSPPSVHSGNFWVEYVNKAIEVGWQNLPSNINKIIIYRSQNMVDWMGLFTQQNPNLVGPYFIRLVDNTFNDVHHYQLSVYSESELVATYGPVTLQPLAQ